MSKKVGTWGGSRSIRLEVECKELGIDVGDEVSVTIEGGNKIVIEKIRPKFKTNEKIKE